MWRLLETPIREWIESVYRVRIYAHGNVKRRYYIAASAFYRQWGCGYKAHKTFKDANAFKVELTPLPSRPTTPRRRSSLSGSGNPIWDSYLTPASGRL